MIAIDTNIVVRMIVDDDPKQTAKAVALFERGPILLLTAVLIEAEWVLRSVYGRSRKEAVGAIERMCGLQNVELAEPSIVEAAIESYEAGIEFSDAVLVHSAAAAGVRTFFTFDRDLVKRSPRVVNDIKVEAP